MPAPSVGSRRSERSDRSRRSTYRRVAQASHVDESLFGAQHSSARSGLRSAGASIAGSHSGRAGRSPVAADAMTLSRADVEAMKLRAQGQHAATSPGRTLRTSTMQPEALARAEARKATMKRLEEERRNVRPPVEVELEARRRGNPVLALARERRETEDDGIKHLAVKLHRMRCKHVLDDQLQERQQLTRAEQEDEELWHTISLEQMRVEAEANARKQAAEREMARANAASLHEQLEERERVKLLESERLEQEKAVMLAAIRADEKRTEAVRQLAKEEQRRRADELARANAVAIERKRIKAQREKEEDLRVMRYLKQQERALNKRMEEEAQRRAEKEREVARLRAMQEREADRQAEDDEKRAQAWQEANERKERERDRERAEFKQRMLEETLAVRAEQMRYKDRVRQRERAAEEREVARIKKDQARAVRQEKEVYEGIRRRNTQYGEELHVQVAEREHKRGTVQYAQREERELMARESELEAKIRQQLVQRMIQDHVKAGFELPPGVRA